MFFKVYGIRFKVKILKILINEAEKKYAEKLKKAHVSRGL